MEEAGGKLASHEDRISLVKDIVNEALGRGPWRIFGGSGVRILWSTSKDEVYVEKAGKLVLTNKRFVSDAKMRDH